MSLIYLEGRRYTKFKLKRKKNTHRYHIKLHFNYKVFSSQQTLFFNNLCKIIYKNKLWKHKKKNNLKNTLWVSQTPATTVSILQSRKKTSPSSYTWGPLLLLFIFFFLTNKMYIRVPSMNMENKKCTLYSEFLVEMEIYVKLKKLGKLYMKFPRQISHLCNICLWMLLIQC